MTLLCKVPDFFNGTDTYSDDAINLNDFDVDFSQCFIQSEETVRCLTKDVVVQFCMLDQEFWSSNLEKGGTEIEYN